TKAIELRNRRVDGVAKPKEVTKSKTSEERENPQKQQVKGTRMWKKNQQLTTAPKQYHLHHQGT
ncbi:hypothetical protein A2U01_0106103, partial [Trifolium medium]|nr:hypothetical protein [Trifolium medium]